MVRFIAYLFSVSLRLKTWYKNVVNVNVTLCFLCGETLWTTVLQSWDKPLSLDKPMDLVFKMCANAKPVCPCPLLVFKGVKTWLLLLFSLNLTSIPVFRCTAVKSQVQLTNNMLHDVTFNLPVNEDFLFSISFLNVLICLTHFTDVKTLCREWSTIVSHHCCTLKL